MLIPPSVKKSLIVGQFQGNYLKPSWNFREKQRVLDTLEFGRPEKPAWFVKVAKHSFACTLADAVQRTHKDCKKKQTNIPLIRRSFYLLNAHAFCAIAVHNDSEPSVLKVLVFHYKGMLERVSMQRTNQFSGFSL